MLPETGELSDGFDDRRRHIRVAMEPKLLALNMRGWLDRTNAWH